MAKGLWRRTLSGYVPEDDRARAIYARHKTGSTVEIDVTAPRNIKALRLYWAMCDKLAQSIGADSENVSDVLKIRTGHVRRIATKQGEMLLPASIAFHAMDDIAFGKFLDACALAVKETWLPHLKPSQIRQELEGMLAA